MVDITFRPVDGLFTAFYPETPAGMVAWQTIAALTDGTGKVLHCNAQDTVQQLREAGYTVARAEAKQELDDDDLLAALEMPSSSHD